MWCLLFGDLLPVICGYSTCYFWILSLLFVDLVHVICGFSTWIKKGCRPNNYGEVKWAQCPSKYFEIINTNVMLQLALICPTLTPLLPTLTPLLPTLPTPLLLSHTHALPTTLLLPTQLQPSLIPTQRTAASFTTNSSQAKQIENTKSFTALKWIETLLLQIVMTCLQCIRSTE